MSSRDAVEAQVKLQAVLKHTAANLFRKSCSSPSRGGGQQDREGPLSPIAAMYVEGIKIELTEEEDGKPGDRVSPKYGEKLSRFAQTRSTKPEKRLMERGFPHPKSAEKVSAAPARSARSSASSASRAKPLQEEESKWMWVGPEKAEKVIPREWYVLSYPLPEVSSVPQSLLAMLKESVKEAVFHESIYYSKKKVSSQSLSQLQWNLR